MGTQKTINSFNAGIDQDTSVNKYGNNTYYDAVDLRITSQNSLSNGTLSNIAGTSAIIRFPEKHTEIVSHASIKDDLYLLCKLAPTSTLVKVDNLTPGTSLILTNDGNSYVYPIVSAPASSGQIDDTFTRQDLIDLFSLNNALSKNVDYTAYISANSEEAVLFSGKGHDPVANVVYVSGTDAFEPDSFSPNLSRSSIYSVLNYNSIDSESSPNLVYNDEDSTSKLNFNSERGISIVGRYETSEVRKIYWANGLDPLRSLKTSNNYIGKEANVFDYIPDVTFSNTSLEKVQGGSLNAGVIQYAYQYYIKNGASTTFSPLSRLIQISNSQYGSFSGGDIGDVIDKSVMLTIHNLDHNFSRIRVVSLFYDTFESIPSLNIIKEAQFSDSDDSMTVIDNGSTIGTLTLEEFLTFSQTTVVPSAIEAKDNLLFMGNLSEDTFSSSAIDNWDSRAYGFTGYGTASIAKIYNTPTGSTSDNHYDILPNGNWTYYPSTGGTITGSNWTVDDGFNCVNRDNSLYENDLGPVGYSFNPDINVGNDWSVDGIYGGVYGGKGKSVEYMFKWFRKRVNQSGTSTPIEDKYVGVEDGSVIDLKECMPNEVYRIAVVFVNDKGQNSFAKWIGDIRTPHSGMKKDFTFYYTPVLEVQLTSLPQDDSIVGFKIVRAKVSNKDKTIKTAGLITNPYSFTVDPTNPGAYISGDGETEQAMPSVGLISGNTAMPTNLELKKDLIEFISPETLFNNANETFNITQGKLIVDNYLAGIQNVDIDGDNITSSLDDNYRDSESLYDNSSYNSSSSTQSYVIDDFATVRTEHVNEPDNAMRTSIGGYSYVNRFKPLGVSNIASRCSGILLKLDTDINVVYSSYTGTENQFLIGSIIENKDISRYGGYTVSDITNTEYVDFSEYKASNDFGSKIKCTFGNVFRDKFDLIRGLYYYETSDTPVKNGSTFQTVTTRIPSYIDMRYRIDKLDKNLDYQYIQETITEGIKLYPESYNEKVGDLYKYNNVYSQNSSSGIYITKPLEFDSSVSNPTKVIASNKKDNGEINDSWTNFLSNNFIEIDGQYGELVNLISFKTKLFFFQENAVGILSVNDRSLIQDNNVGQLSLGSGGVLDRFDYLSYFSGISNKKDVIQSKTTIYFIDESSKRIYTINDPDKAVSEIKGVHSLLGSKIISGEDRAIGFDSEFNEVLFSLDDITLCYNENLGSFTSRYGFVPNYLISTAEGLYSSKYDAEEGGNSYIFKHNSNDIGIWYGEIYGSARSVSKVILLINPNGNIINTFDNIDLRTEVYSRGQNAPEYSDLVTETVSRLKFKNSYINDITIESATSGYDQSKIKRLARAWRAQVPLTENSNRFVDSYLMLTLEFDNNNDKLFKLHDVTTYFRQSSR